MDKFKPGDLVIVKKRNIDYKEETQWYLYGIILSLKSKFAIIHITDGSQTAYRLDKITLVAKS